LRYFYEANPSIGQESYFCQHEALGYGYVDLWKKDLEARGEWFVEEVVVNAELLQKQWAREHGIRLTGAPWVETILREQLRQFRPDVWFCHSHEISPGFRARMRKENPSIKFVFGYDGIDACRAEHFVGCDLVVVLLEKSRAYYKANGYRSHVRKLGFDTHLLERLSFGQHKHPVSFVGSIDLRERGHNERLKLLSYLIGRVPLTTFTPPLPTGIRLLRKSLGCLGRFDLGSLRTVYGQIPSIRRLQAVNCGPVFGFPMFQALADSRITLNCHIDAAGNTAANWRLFQSTGVGTCLVTDWKDNLPALFDPDREVVTYRSPIECAEKIQYLLSNEKKRQELAAHGQRRTLRDHALSTSNLALMEWIRQVM